ncbi:MAG: hypothetical protein ABIK92_11755 [Pseudomonadota bacterium]
MGWTIYYTTTLVEQLSPDEEKTINTIIKKWNKKLEDGCEYLFLEKKDNGKTLEGFSKVQHSIEPEEDFKRIVSALKEIEKTIPVVKFKITDDYGFINEIELG